MSAIGKYDKTIIIDDPGFSMDRWIESTLKIESQLKGRLNSEKKMDEKERRKFLFGEYNNENTWEGEVPS